MSTGNDPELTSVFALARGHLAGCPGVDPSESDDNADSLVYALYRAGYVTWPGRAPNRVASHPLTGVPRELLETIYRALGDWPNVTELEDDDIVSIGDAVAANLGVRGYLTWPGRVPDRDALVLAVMSAQAWQSDEDGRTVAEYLVDTVVLPLLAGVVGPSRSSPATDRRPRGG